MEATVHPINAAVPNWGFRAPGGPKQELQWSEMRFSRMRVLYVLECTFFSKKNEICESLQLQLLKRRIPSVIIQA